MYRREKEREMLVILTGLVAAAHTHRHGPMEAKTRARAVVDLAVACLAEIESRLPKDPKDEDRGS